MVGAYQLSVNNFGLKSHLYLSNPHVELTVGFDNTWILEHVRKSLVEECRCALDEGRYDDMKEIADVIKELEESIKVLDKFAESQEKTIEESFEDIDLDLDI